jgi:hypothetical protein
LVRWWYPTATAGFAASHPVSPNLSALHGYQIAFLTAGIMLATGALATLLLVNARPTTASRNQSLSRPVPVDTAATGP